MNTASRNVLSQLDKVSSSHPAFLILILAVHGSYLHLAVAHGCVTFCIAAQVDNEVIDFFVPAAERLMASENPSKVLAAALASMSGFRKPPRPRRSESTLVWRINEQCCCRLQNMLEKALQP
jgi:hypothetical protein